MADPAPAEQQTTQNPGSESAMADPAPAEQQTTQNPGSESAMADPAPAEQQNTQNPGSESAMADPAPAEQQTTQNPGSESAKDRLSVTVKIDDLAVNPTKTQELATTLPLFALNHISFLVKDLKESARFYEKVMGFVIIKRPDVFGYEGIWMFGHGIAIQLHGKKGGDDKSGGTELEINPAYNHISFQCSNLYSMLRVLQTSNVNYKTFQTKIDGKIVVNRINFYDPDGHMIEIADSQNLPIVPLSKLPPKSMPTPNLEFITCAKETCKPSDNCLCCDDDKADEVFDLENIPSEYHLLAMNHVGCLCKSLEASLEFYKEVLGFVSIEVPKDENWDDEKYKRAWLFGHGIGIHLIQEDCACPSPIGTQFVIGFQCTNMYDIMTRLEEKAIKYFPMDIKVDGKIVNEIFFQDLEGNVIEFCTLQNLPIVPIAECPPRKMPTPNLDPSKKELPCKPKWPPCKCKKVEEDCYEVCYKTCKPKVICKPKVVKCCEEIVTCDAVQEELKPCA